MALPIGLRDRHTGAFSEQELADAGERSAFSLRHLHDRAYARRASRCLADLEWWKDLVEGLSVPQCILAELGRIRDDAQLREAASWYGFSAGGLTAKQAATKIREMRTGKTPEEGPGTLYKGLMRAVRDFRIYYPDASLLYQEGQVELVLRTIRQFQR